MHILFAVCYCVANGTLFMAYFIWQGLFFLYIIAFHLRLLVLFARPFASYPVQNFLSNIDFLFVRESSSRTPAFSFKEVVSEETVSYNNMNLHFGNSKDLSNVHRRST